jgi:hypothetical protein
MRECVSKTPTPPTFITFKSPQAFPFEGFEGSTGRRFAQTKDLGTVGSGLLPAARAQASDNHPTELYGECEMTETTAPKQRGRPFRSGISGNPLGRPKGARNRATLALEALLDGQAEALTQKAIELALAGDITALRLCLDRILPTRKDRPVTFGMPPISSAGDAKAASGALLAAVSEGRLTPNEAAEIGKLIEAYVKAAELTEVLARIDNLEQKL